MDKTLKTFSNEVHKPRRKIFQRRKVFVNSIDEIWAMDLASMENIADDNKGFKFILCIIDVFSKYAWCIPLKNKSSSTVLDAVKKVVIDSGRIPTKIWVDQGSEFYNKLFQTWIKSKKITMYSTYGESKSVVAERFIRTIRTNIERLITETKSRDWVGNLDMLVDNYNNTKHSTIRMTPTEASKPENEITVFNNLNLKPKRKEIKKAKFKVGDQVRISKIKKTFEKGFKHNWTFEVFTIEKVLDTEPITYKIVDFDNEPVEGSFYSEELQKTDVPDHYEVEEILETRKVGKKKEYLIKFLGWPAKFNLWVGEDQISDIKK